MREEDPTFLVRQSRSLRDSMPWLSKNSGIHLIQLNTSQRCLLFQTILSYVNRKDDISSSYMRHHTVSYKERRKVVFVNSHQRNKIKTHAGRQKSPPVSGHWPDSPRKRVFFVTLRPSVAFASKVSNIISFATNQCRKKRTYIHRVESLVSNTH